MVVILLERVPVSLRGQLSRWMIEPKTGVFVGKVSAMVRDKLWEMICKKAKAGAAVLICNSLTEQGFSVRLHGEPSRELLDWEGLTLVRIKNSTREVGQEESP